MALTLQQQAILDALQDPLRVKIKDTEREQQRLKDQVVAAEYLDGADANKVNFGLRFTQLTPPGLG